MTAANNEQQAMPSGGRAPLYPFDELSKACLQQAGFSLVSVPPTGVWATLRPIESTNWGGLDEDYSSSLHPDNPAIACRALRSRRSRYRYHFTGHHPALTCNRRHH
jgi:cyanophycin synthetase